ncbi:MAG: LLM class flavin-dependent oxidoreductase [Acidimicrobiia bacterium]|nr:LLM class flavin-dependent oxidoreductase [Acidimicrobiia bacterium]
MGLGFGLLSAQLRPGEKGWTRAYEETVGLAVKAEELGMHSIWTTEHHFVDDGYMPSLLVVSAAIAQATSIIEIGTGVLLAPLHHPIRLAEDAATVNLLSNGRLTLGLGIGWSTVEFDAFGASMRTRGGAMDEVLAILPKAWSGEPFRHQGAVYDLPEVGVRPTPASKIPILIGGSAEPAVRRAARLADGVFANAPAPQFLQQVEWIHDELDRIGRDPATFRIVYYSVMIPGDSAAEAWARGTEHLWQMMWKYSDMEASALRSGPPPTAEPLTDDRRDELFGRGTSIGPSPEIVESLHQIRADAGSDVEFVARSYFPTMSYGEQVELMERLATEVAPHL